MPLVDADALSDLPRDRRDAALKRAYVLLGLAVQSYARGDGVAIRSGRSLRRDGDFQWADAAPATWSARAAGATWIVRGRVAAPPRPRDGDRVCGRVAATVSKDDDRRYRRGADWGGNGGAEDADAPPATLPRQLGEPWAKVCAALDLPSGSISACGTDLWNWLEAPRETAFLTPEGKRRRASEAARKNWTLKRLLTPRWFWKENAAAGPARGVGAAPRVLSATMTGSPAETAFHLLAARTHARAARELPALLRLPDDVFERNAHAIHSTLSSVKRFLEDAAAIFSEAASSVDKDVFYDTLRPLLSGSSKAPLR